ncbi:polysaccharide deacetylase family protein [Bacillus sp. T33-2]|uniref:polysaccharide deacetylase family protein n=1 Tax=Bacillus sp. T33-2 TaxID=2054168 RepID=UPI000C7890DF|nr:polysaccharide deacetylase family protein [Bacillus sp. T33-2]PLR97443.1 polysaccharide deacetylase [Bacillus sp. T33-2]
MKKLTMYCIIAFLVFLVSSCNSTETTKPEPDREAKQHANTVEREQAKSVSKSDEKAVNQSQAYGDLEAALPKKPEYRINPANWAVEPLANQAVKPVLLTIDDAPDKHALEMARTLQRLGVKAIFFVNGHFLTTPEKEAELKEINRLGFPIGNHTFNHKKLTELSEQEQRQQIVSLNDRVESITGERPKFFRAPFGANTDISRQVAAEQKMVLMNWTYGYDWEKEYQTKEAIAKIMVDTPLLRSGATLLMHDRPWTSQALEDIVKGLQARGFTIVDPDLIEKPA